MGRFSTREWRYEWEGLDEMVALLDSAKISYNSVINDTAMEIMVDVARDAQSKARSGPGTLPRAASTIKAVMDGGDPGIEMGGSKIVSSRGATAGETMFGYDFGSKRYKQFPSIIPGGSTVFPAWEDHKRKTEKMLGDATAKWWTGRGIKFKVNRFFGR